MSELVLRAMAPMTQPLIYFWRDRVVDYSLDC